MSKRAVIVALLGAVLMSGSRRISAATEEPSTAPAAQAATFSKDQLEQMVAPIALYPDTVMIQVMMASTYPLEVVEADRWARANPTVKGDAIDKAVADKGWDPSVASLTHFPDLLKRMSDNLDWTKDLGDAFLGQKDELLDAVQRMRKMADDAGNLKTTKEQTVTQTVVNNKETIVIQPTDPETVYVPSYPPQQVYGPSYAPPAPYYPSMYASPYPPGYVATTGLLAFGAGFTTAALIGGACNWGNYEVDCNGCGGGGGGGNKNNNNVNIDNSKNFNKSGGNRGKWEHNPEHRRNVGYRDQRTSQRFEGRDRAAARDRESARGFDRGGDRGGRNDRMADRGDLGDRGGDRGGRGDNRGDRGGRGDNRGDRGGPVTTAATAAVAAMSGTAAAETVAMSATAAVAIAAAATSEAAAAATAPAAWIDRDRPAGADVSRAPSAA